MTAMQNVMPDKVVAERVAKEQEPVSKKNPRSSN